MTPPTPGSTGAHGCSEAKHCANRSASQSGSNLGGPSYDGECPGAHKVCHVLPGGRLRAQKRAVKARNFHEFDRVAGCRRPPRRSPFRATSEPARHRLQPRAPPWFPSEVDEGGCTRLGRGGSCRAAFGPIPGRFLPLRPSPGRASPPIRRRGPVQPLCPGRLPTGPWRRQPSDRG